MQLTQLNCLTQGDRLSPQILEVGAIIAKTLELPPLEKNDLYAIDNVIGLIAIAKTKSNQNVNPQLYELLQAFYTVTYANLLVTLSTIPQLDGESIKLFGALYNYQSTGPDKYPFRYPIIFALLTVSKILATQDIGYQGPTYSQKQLAGFAYAIKRNFDTAYIPEQKAIQTRIGIGVSTITKVEIQNLCNAIKQTIPLDHSRWNPQHWKPYTYLTIFAACCLVALAVAIITGTRNVNRLIHTIEHNLQQTTDTIQQASDAVLQTADSIGGQQEGSLLRIFNDSLQQATEAIRQTVASIGIRQKSDGEFPEESMAHNFNASLQKITVAIQSASESVNQISASLGTREEAEDQFPEGTMARTFNDSILLITEAIQQSSDTLHQSLVSIAGQQSDGKFTEGTLARDIQHVLETTNSTLLQLRKRAGNPFARKQATLHRRGSMTPDQIKKHLPGEPEAP